MNGLLMLAMPLGLGVVLSRRTGRRWGLYGAGALTFIGSQVLHLPFNGLVLNPQLAALGFGERGLSGTLVLSAVLLGLSSGVFEEGARFLVLRFWQRSARSWRDSLMFGAGHGGTEAILVGALALVAFFQALAYRNTDLSQILPADQVATAASQVEAYWTAPWPFALLGAAERAFSLAAHLSLSAMVMRAFTHRNAGWLVAAIGWHALINTLAVIALFTVSPVATEGLIGLTAGVSVGILFALREPPVVVSAEPGEQLARVTAAKASLPLARVEDSKYAE
ncbi:MAG TPA: YhfC family glutamic-type intramembrane protease [Anaerolineales bacterium]|nr:YhfC family glutamic-type intramembrane protease [Anaerolineales bacterium]